MHEAETRAYHGQAGVEPDVVPVQRDDAECGVQIIALTGFISVHLQLFK